MAHEFSRPKRHLCPDRETEHEPQLGPQPSQQNEFQGLGLRGGDGSQRYGESEEEEQSSEEEEENEQMQPRSRHRAPASHATNGLGKNEFQPGAIVRVKLQNFVTYEKAEFSLGPNLNMVIGPNGTGKSSLVCAICLGLGYPSHVLGRASVYGEFVKHGKDEAQIEVELQKKPGEARNHIVGLCIRREDNSRKFTLNGQRVSHKDVQQLMKSLRIQIDNLCQFLPQDKVAEFAGLGPVELLDKTLQAAAPEQMIEWQKDLKDHFKAQKEAQVSAEESNNELRKMEARQQVLQADVEKLRERKEIQSNIEQLERVSLVVKYNEARKQYKEIKLRKKEAEDNLKRLQTSSAPSLQAVNRKQNYQEQIQKVVDARKARLGVAESAAGDAVAAIEAAEAKCQGIAAKGEAEKANNALKRQELATWRKKLTGFEAQYKQAPKPFDAAEWNRRIREQDHLSRDKTTEMGDVGAEMERLRVQGHANRKEAEKIKTEITNLESQQGQLLNYLKKTNSDVAQGWEWLQEHQGEFQKEVFGPPMLTCSINNLQYSDLVQSMLAQSDFLCFTTQTKEDHKRLSNQLYRVMGLQVTIRSCFTPYSSFRPPVPKADLSRLGLDGFVTDYLEGPEPVLAMLCSTKRAHQSAVGLKDISDDQFERIKQGEVIDTFAAGKQLYRTSRRREYGPGAVSTRVMSVSPGRFWTDQPPDTAEKTELQQKLNEANEKEAEIMRSYKEQKARKAALEQELTGISEQLINLRKQKNELQKEYNVWLTLPDKIETQKKAIAQRRTEMEEARARITQSELDHDQAVLEKARAILQHHKRMGDIRKAYQSLLEAQLVLIAAKSDVSALKAKNAEINQQLEAEKQAVKELGVQLKAMHIVASDAKSEVEPFLVDEQEKDKLLALASSRTGEDVNNEMAAERAKLEVIQASNPLALEEFEKWAARIDKERANHTAQENRLADLNHKIDTIRGQWEPKLDELIGRINDAFSYNFEQISCAGEVGVHKDEDFEKWAIEIRVKFRENETLQRLDQHRQSGGERAVSTIFYLMSLQSMAQAPFRVVDEINQGMDPRNERMVHERMVEIACREHSSQYFLITPKLLSGLRYDERMRVHTIVSGEHVDEDGTEKMNFARFAKIQRALKDK